MEIPIACTLSASDARSQLSEWQGILSHSVDNSERVSPNRLQLRFSADADIESVINLAQRESACCTFFSFSIEIATDHLLLIIEVPNEAVQILDQLTSDSSG